MTWNVLSPKMRRGHLYRRSRFLRVRLVLELNLPGLLEYPFTHAFLF